jgi:Ca-activated chloride channel family protein
MRALISFALAGTALVAAALAPRLVAAPPPVQGAQPPPVVAPVVPPVTAVADEGGELRLTARLDRSAVLAGDTLRVELGLDVPHTGDDAPRQPTDLVLVVDRSGSMGGDKLTQAQRAGEELLALLSADDRAAVVSFSSSTHVDQPLRPVSGASFAALRRLRASGGTQLQAGLIEGLGNLGAPEPGRSRRLIVLTDGRPDSLVGLDEAARLAQQREVPLTTVGIGSDYDPQLLQHLADQGGGNFYWARPGMPLATIFTHEFEAARRVAARGTRLSMAGGAELLDVAGLPADGGAWQLGELFEGQRRSLWLTVRVPSHVEPDDALSLGTLQLQWTDPDGRRHQQHLDLPTVAVVSDARVAAASVDRDTWAQGVLDDDYNALKAQVAAELARGDQAAAIRHIDAYDQRNAMLNAAVGSQEVADNLQQVQSLKKQVQGDQLSVLDRVGLAAEAWSGRRKGQTYGSSLPAPAPRPR